MKPRWDSRDAHMAALFDLLDSEGFLWRQRHSEALAVGVVSGPAYCWLRPKR